MTDMVHDPRGGQARIDWTDFNFPPGLNLVHFDVSELSAERRFIVRTATANFALLLFTFFLNFISACVLTGGDIFSGQEIAYTIFNVFLWACVGFYLVYWLYKGIATGSEVWLGRFIWAWAFFSLLAFSFSIASGSFLNGWSNFRNGRLGGCCATEKQGSVKTYWLAMTVIESLLFMFSSFLGVWVCFTVFRFRRDGPRKNAAGNKM